MVKFLANVFQRTSYYVTKLVRAHDWLAFK